MNVSAQHVLIAANPKSGSSSSASRVSELREAIEQAGFICEIVGELPVVQQRSAALHRDGRLRAVVSAGGDGTADALANLLSSQIPILLFPLGTENLLAKHLGITGDAQQACQSLQHNRTIAMDVGSANGQLFLVMLSCGFDAEVVGQMHAVRRGHINRWSYTRPILAALAKYRFPQLPFRIDEQPAPSTAAWIFVFNVPRYAASLEFCPQADPLDGQLDVCTFQRGGIAFGVGYFSRLFFRSHQSMRGFRHQRCSQIMIESPPAFSGRSHAKLRVASGGDSGGDDGDCPYQIDGDPGGVLPLKVKVLPGRLKLLTPIS